MENLTAGLTPAQRDLMDRVLQTLMDRVLQANRGEDLCDVLLAQEAPAADKEAVAEVFGGPGAGAEFLRQGRPEQMWPGRVDLRHGGSYIVDEKWAVVETDGRWEAWPYPECVDPSFDDEAYRAQHLRGKGLDRASVAEKIADLIGEPR
jgi:hypothetical protein